MFALQVETNPNRPPPTVLDEDRFPCTWIEWKGLHIDLFSAGRDKSQLVVLVPAPPGIFIMNPSSSDANAEFLGELVAIPVCGFSLFFSPLHLFLTKI